MCIMPCYARELCDAKGADFTLTGLMNDQEFILWDDELIKAPLLETPWNQKTARGR